MTDQLHIIVAGDRGKILRLPVSKKKLRVVAITSAVVLLFLTVTSFFSIYLFTSNRNISNQLAELQENLRIRDSLIAEHKKTTEEERLKLDRKVANLEKSTIQQASTYEEEKESLLTNAVNELNERSEMIEKIISSIGIKLPKPKKESSKNSGGPFIEDLGTEKDELLMKADKYLKTIKHLPFGRPVKGRVTSGYGKRKDPMNKKSAFHTGTDFRGKRGDKIYATADGVVKKAFRNGGYGNYVLIDHKNGYTTSFSHMKKYLVKKGEKVERGQLIGYVGNSGRSTGPHLHYEVCLDKKPINPLKFMRLAKLSKSLTSSAEKK